MRPEPVVESCPLCNDPLTDPTMWTDDEYGQLTEYHLHCGREMRRARNRVYRGRAESQTT